MGAGGGGTVQRVTEVNCGQKPLWWFPREGIDKAGQPGLGLAKEFQQAQGHSPGAIRAGVQWHRV